MNKYILCTLITAITNCKTIDHTNDIDPQKVKELCTNDKAVQSFNYQQKHVEVPNNNELYTLKKEIPFEDCKQIKNRRWTDNKCLLSCDNKKLDKENIVFLTYFANFYPNNSCDEILLKLKESKSIDLRNLGLSSLEQLEDLLAENHEITELNLVGNNINDFSYLKNQKQLKYFNYDYKENLPLCNSVSDFPDGVKNYCQRIKKHFALYDSSRAKPAIDVPQEYLTKLPHPYEFVYLNGITKNKSGLLGEGAHGIVYLIRKNNDLFIVKFFKSKDSIMDDDSHEITEEKEIIFSNALKVFNFDKKNRFAIKSLHLGPTFSELMKSRQLYSGSSISIKILKQYKKMVINLWKKGYILGDLNPENIIYDLKLKNIVVIDSLPLRKLSSCTKAATKGIKILMGDLNMYIKDPLLRYKNINLAKALFELN